MRHINTEKFNLPLEIVIEDNGKSVKTDTKVWNLKKINFPKIYFTTNTNWLILLSALASGDF